MADLRQLAVEGRLVYYPATDELISADGRRIPRPAHIPREQLRSITYNGSNESPPSVIGRAPQQRHAPRRPDAQRPGMSAASVSPSALPQSSALTQSMANMSIAGSEVNRRPNPYTANQLQEKINALTRSPTSVSSAQVIGYPVERLHPRYKSRPSSFFTVGKVFSMLWSEPMGDVASSRNVPTIVTSKSVAVTTGPFGEQIYSKIRRFVVIRSGESGYCNALPISTYEGRGVSKIGVKKSEHTVIYCNPRPKLLDAEKAGRNEEPMRPNWIRVDPDGKEEKLDPMARLNFGSPVTIQYNVKVKSCGQVARESMHDLILQFASVFTPSRSLTAQIDASSSTDRRPSRNSTRNSGSVISVSSSSRPSGSSRSAASPTEPSIDLQAALEHKIRQGMSLQDAVRSLVRDSRGTLSEAAAREVLLRAVASDRRR